MRSYQRAQAQGIRRRTRGRFVGQVEWLEGRALLAAWFVDASNAGTEDGSQAHPYRHIQAAIDHALTPGDEVRIAAGVYAENLTVSHSVKLLGPNAGINPNAAGRQPEAVLLPAANNPVGGRMILVTGNNVTIDGLTIDGHNGSLPAGVALNNISVNAASGISNVDSSGLGQPPVIDGLRVQNNIIRNLTSFGVIVDINDFSLNPLAISKNNAITNNRLDNMPDNNLSGFGGPSFNPGRGISIEHNFYADVTGNVVTRAGTAIQAIFMLDDPHHAPYSISNNELHAYAMGLYLWTIDSEVPIFNVAGNRVFAENDPKTLPDSSGIRLNRVLHTTGVTLSNNDVFGAHAGLLLQYTSAVPTVGVAGGTLDGNDYGVLLTNALPPGGNAPVLASLGGVTIKNSHVAALGVVDTLAPSGTAVTLTVDGATTLAGNNRGAELTGADAKLAESVKPVVTLTGTPSAQTTDRMASFSFSATDNISSAGDLRIQYKLDNGGFVTATSPVGLSGLAIGAHTLIIQATDQAGNTGSASFQWTISAVPPPASPSTPALDAASDTGSSNGDGLTRDNTPTFIGTAPPGTTVALFAGSTKLGSTTAGSSGNWSFTVGGAGAVVASLADGPYAITATAQNANGVSPPSGALAVVIDTGAPTVSFTGAPPAQTTDTSATFAFGASDGASSGTGLAFLYSLDSGPLTPATSPVGLSGLAVGPHTFLVQATDQAGNTGSNSVQWTVAPVGTPPPPAAPSTPALDAASDTGSSNNDDITSDATPTFTGTAPAATTVALFAGSTRLGTTTADASGHWSFTVGVGGAVVASLADGSYAITASAEDANGVSPPSGALAVVIDTGAPTVSFTGAPPAQTTDTSATFAFGASDGASSGTGLAFLYSLDSGPLTPATSPVGLSGLAVGSHTFLVQATDQAGNTGSNSVQWTVNPPTPARPDAPSTPALDAASDTGSSSSDGITSDNTPIFTGTAPASTTVTLFAGSTTLGTTTADGSGHWSFTVGGAGSVVASLADGLYDIRATATNAGGTSQASGARAMLIDTVAPSIQTASSPQPNAAGWNRTNVVGSYAAGDGGSGLASPATGSFTFSSQGAGQTRVFTVKDVAGNTASATVGPVNIDKGKPSVSIAASPGVLQPADGRLVSVTVSGKVTDSLSGPGASVTYTLRDSYGVVAGNGTVKLGAGGSYSIALSLPASLNGRKSTRTFTITVTGQDAAGNTKAVSTTVKVTSSTGSGTVTIAKVGKAILHRVIAHPKRWR